MSLRWRERGFALTEIRTDTWVNRSAFELSRWRDGRCRMGFLMDCWPCKARVTGGYRDPSSAADAGRTPASQLLSEHCVFLYLRGRGFCEVLPSVGQFELLRGTRDNFAERKLST
jgi:hypothetical protein